MKFDLVGFYIMCGGYMFVMCDIFMFEVMC